jgi:hypothetical protein
MVMDVARWRLPAAALSALLLAGCAAGDGEAADEARPAVVNVMATDFAFDMPETIAAGPVTFRLMNHGEELHHLQLIRLEEGRTFEDFAALDPGAPPPSWVVFIGGPNAPPPAGTSDVTVDLVAGDYVAICFIPSPDGVPHVAKGMVKAFTVTPGEAEAPMPSANITMALHDYSFELSAPLTAGRHTIRVVTETEQPHEVVFVALEEGKTAYDVVMWLEGGMQGPPPGTVIGGTVALSKGEVNLVHIDLAPGHYALLCFVPDAGDGRPHVAHGMMTDLVVQ